jgi:hypothetical protein
MTAETFFCVIIPYHAKTGTILKKLYPFSKLYVSLG